MKELDNVAALIDWRRIERLFDNIHTSRVGQLAWPPVMMFKVLLLQSWYRLSDPGSSKQLARDLLFRRFVNLGIEQAVPDHSTIWRFRNKLEEQGLFVKALAVVNNQLAEQGWLIRAGEVSIIDASVIEAKSSRPRRNAKKENTQDPEASYNVKTGSDGHRKTTYGYKVHMNVEEDGFIKKTTYTAGHVHDSTQFEALLTDNEEVVYADSAYKSQKHTELLRERKITERITHRAYRNKPLSAAQRKLNRQYAGTRYIVEQVFGVLKLHYGMAKARYMGLKRNQARLGMMRIAYNLKRAANLQKECWALTG